jgi:hypothetical protein
VHSQKTPFKLYPEEYLVEWWMMHLFSYESPSLGPNFSSHPLMSDVAISWEKLNPAPQILEDFCILSKVLSFSLVLFPILVYLADKKTR